MTTWPLVCSEDGQCPCTCDYSVDAACTCRDLQGSVTVHVTKSPVALLYPVTYLKTVNYLPLEKVQHADNCKDGDFEDNPTCGWYHIDGERATDSQVRAHLDVVSVAPLAWKRGGAHTRLVARRAFAAIARAARCGRRRWAAQGSARARASIATSSRIHTCPFSVARPAQRTASCIRTSGGRCAPRIAAGRARVDGVCLARVGICSRSGAPLCMCSVAALVP